MNASPWGPDEVRLWGGSALGALLMHVVPAALLILYIQWTPRLPPQAGSHIEMDVELAAPSAASPVASTTQQAPSQSQARPRPPTPAQPAEINPLRPLGEMKPAPQQADTDAPSNAPQSAVVRAASAPPVGSSDLGAAAAGLTVQLWLDEVRAQLKSHMVYPSSAIQQMQREGVMQDTVTLQFSVDKAGQVTYSHVDSEHHYQDLEQETRQMVRLASNLPAPPSLVSPDAVVTVPVQFELDIAPTLCSGSNCSTAKAAQSKPHVIPPPRPTLDSCRAAPSPGPAPAGSMATLQQMNAYRDSLNQYLAAAGNQLACLSQVDDASAPGLRDNLAGQLHSMVADFNAQALVFEAKAQARAQQAAQEREQQAQALAAQIYGTCTAPTVLKPPGALSAQEGVAFRKQLVGYESAVRSYVACLQQADRAAADPARGLASDQRAQLQQSAAQLGNAAIASFNQVAGSFNAQVPQIRKAVAAEEQLAEALVRGARIFPTSSWNLPEPLPADECVYITEVGQGYQAHLCVPGYGTTVSDLAQELKNNVNQQNLNAAQEVMKHQVEFAADNSGVPAADLQVEAIAAQHGFPSDGTPCQRYCAAPILGIANTTLAGFGNQQQSAGSHVQTISYTVSELQVAGRRVSMTITRRTDQESSSDTAVALHMDLALAPDNQTLRGYCWVGQQRSPCTLTRHGAGPAPESSRH